MYYMHKVIILNYIYTGRNHETEPAEIQLLLKNMQSLVHVILRLTSLFRTWKIKIGGERDELPHAQ